MNLDQIVHIGGLLILGVALIFCCFALWQDWRDLLKAAYNDTPRRRFLWQTVCFVLSALALLSWILLHGSDFLD